MKAAVLGDTGVEIRDVPEPVPKPHEILVRVHAAALNRADVAIAAGEVHGIAAGTLLGGECAGEIAAVGSGVTDFKPGDRIAGSAPGSFAEYVAVDAGRAYRLPAIGMAYDKAACLPWALQTMHNAIVTAGRLQDGRVGADPGRQLRRRPARAADRQAEGRCRGAGNVDRRRPPRPAQGTRLRRRPRLARSAHGPTQAKEATGGKGVDLIVDQVSAGVSSEYGGGPVLGRIVNVGRLGGMTGEFDFDLHALNASAISASPFVPARPRNFAPLSGRPTPICGQRSRQASSACRSTAPLPSMR